MLYKGGGEGTETERERESERKSSGRRHRPIDKQINRGWKDDPQSYRSTWLRLSHGFPTRAFTQAARSRRGGEAGTSALGIYLSFGTGRRFWVIYKKR